MNIYQNTRNSNADKDKQSVSLSRQQQDTYITIWKHIDELEMVWNMLPHIIGFDKEKPQVSSRRNQLKMLRHLRQKTYDIVVQNTNPSDVSVIIIVMLI